MNLSRFLSLSIGYLLLSLGVSPITSKLFPGIGNVIEPFIFIGALIITRKESFHIPFWEVFKSHKSIVALVLLVIFGLVGLVTPIGNIDDNDLVKFVYADFRSCYLFYYSFLLLCNNKWDNEQKVIFLRKIVWIIIVMGFYATYDKLNENIIGNGSSVERVLGIPTHFLVIQSFLYSRMSRYIESVILLVLGGYYAVFSYARINIFFFAVQVLLFLIPLLITKSRGFFQSATKKMVLIGVVVSLFYVIPKAYDYYTSSEGGRAQVQRIQDGQESERTNSLFVPFTDMDFYFLPEGLGWRNHIYKLGQHYNYKILSTQDSSFLYLFYHFGFFIGLFLNVYILFSIYKNFVREVKHPTSVTFLIGLVALAFLMGFFTQGIYFTVPQNAVAGGLMLYIITKRHQLAVQNI